MIPSFDIFRKDSTGNLIWIEAARTQEDAKARIQEFAGSCPGDYVVFDQTTGSKLTIDAGAGGALSQSNPLHRHKQDPSPRSDGSEAAN